MTTSARLLVLVALSGAGIAAAASGESRPAGTKAPAATNLPAATTSKPAATGPAAATTAATAAPAAWSADAMKRLKQEHPRLLVDAAGFARVKRLVATNPDAKRWYASLRAEAEETLASAPSTYVIPDRKRLLATSRRVKERVQALALVYKLDGGARYRDRMWRELDAAAKFKDWNPSHFLDTAEMTYAFALAYDWLFADWSADERRVLRAAIVDKGLRPGLEVYRSGAGWPLRVNNWNQVCNGGLGIGALAVADDEPVLAAEILGRALASLPLAVGHYAPDGAGTEGVTYWDYGARYNILFIDALQTALGTDFGLAAIPGFKESGAYQIFMSGARGMAFDFADCGLQRVSTPMHFWMARRYDRPLYSWFRLDDVAPAAGAGQGRTPAEDGAGQGRGRGPDRDRDRNKGDGGRGGFLDLLWFDDRGRGFDAKDLPLDRHFRHAECASMRSAWVDPDALVLGIQAGDNNKLSGHRHLDLGSFILEAGGERWIIDSGIERETYMKHLHGNELWTYYRIRAEGHNTLVVNPGGGPDQVLDATAKITAFESRPDGARAVVDLSAAYAPHARQATRTFLLEDARRRVVIRDRVLADRPVDLWWFAHTEADVALAPGRRRATLAKGGKRLVVDISSPDGATFEMRDAAPLPSSPKPRGQAPNAGRRKLAIHFPAVADLDLTVKLELARPR